MKLLVAIPCYGKDLHEAGRALFLAVEKVRAATTAPVHVFHAPDRKPSLPTGVTSHAVALLPEPDSTLPPGWFTAATSLARLAPGCAVLVVNPWNARLSSDRVGQAVAEMLKSRPPVLLSTVQCADHPCQWEEYFDIVDSQVFTPVDSDDDGVGALAAQELGLGPRVHVSLPFVMPSSGPWPQTQWTGRLFEWLPAEGILRSVSRANAGQSGLPPEQRVFLWQAGGAVVRQVAFCEEDLAALPLFRPVAQAGACFLRRSKDFWGMGLSPRCSRAERYQLFPVPSRADAEDTTGGTALRPVRLGSQTQVSGSPFLNAATTPRQIGVPLFLLNALAPAALPQADISLPYHPAYGGWIVDPLTMLSRDSVTGDPIMGRQCFPEVLQMEGSLLGLSSESAGDPMAALLGVGKVNPLAFEESETAPPKEPPLRSLSFPAEREAEPMPSSRRADAFLERVRALRTEIEGVRTAGKSGHDGTDALSHLGRAMKLLADVQRDHAALVLERDTVVAQVREYDERLIDLLPLRIHMQHQAKSLRRIPPDLVEGVLDPLADALFAAWADSREASGTEATLEAMREQAAELGLHPCWASGLPLALARRGAYREALDILREAYALKPWLRDEHARIGVTCFRPQFRFDEYLFWMDQDAVSGRMSSPWINYYCEALAVCRREEQAERVAEAAYARHPNLANLHAVIAWWRFGSRDFLPVKALPGFEKDASRKRLEGIFVILYAAMLAAAGELDRACRKVAEIYAKDTSLANGYAMIGWYHHFLRRRDPDAAIAFFERDQSLGKLDATWKSYLAAAHAFKGDMKTAEHLVHAAYAELPLLNGCMAQIGLTHWLRHHDLETVLHYFQLDVDLGRLTSVDMQLVYFCVLTRAGQGDTEFAAQLLDHAPPTVMTWDLCVARLGFMGFNEDEAAAFMGPEVRAKFLSRGTPAACAAH